MDNYHQIIEAKFKTFWSVGDPISCVRVFLRPDNTCELCGYSPIKWNHVLQNWRTKKTLTVGSECVIQFRGVAAKLQSDFRVGYRERNRKAAELIERRAPGATFILPEPQPENPAWDQFYDNDAALLALELAEYADDFARSGEDGWFYSDKDPVEVEPY